MSYKSISSTTITDYKRYIHDYNMSGIGFCCRRLFRRKSIYVVLRRLREG